MNQTIIKLNEVTIKKINVEQTISSYMDIVKELVENSIDGDSDSIYVFLDFKNHGVEVVDNGIGMSEKDLANCTLAYNTSKFTDLANIQYLGFRGKGLFAIKESGHLEIITRQSDSLWGYKLTVDLEGAIHIEKFASNIGTTVKIHNIFYKSMNKRNFLSPIQEFLKIISFLEQMALAYPYIKFHLFKNQKHHISFGGVKDLIKQIFNIENHTTINIKGENNDFQIKALVNQNPKEKKGKNLFFINKRPLKDCGVLILIKKAIEKQIGEKNLSFLLVFLELDPSYVDINLNSSKNKARISIMKSIQDTIGKFFKQPVNLKSTYSLMESSKNLLEYQHLEGWFVYKNKFIFAHYNKKVYVIDQHAISERIIFNTLMKENYEIQLLLEKITIKLTEEEKLILNYHGNLLEKKKILFQIVDSYMLIYGIPNFLPINDVEHTVRLFFEDNDEHVFLHKLSEIACKNSIKGGFRINESEILSFFRYIYDDVSCAFCNHGRNTYHVLEDKEIKKWFNL